VTESTTTETTTEAAVGTAPAPDETPWQRVDPRTIVVKPFNEAMAALIPIVIGLFAAVQHHSIYSYIWTFGIIGLLILRGVLHWATTRYRITGDQVELRTGLIFRQRVATKRDRLRTVEATAKFGHRIFGVTAVRIGTGQHEQKKRKGGLSLDAVTVAEGERLRKLLLNRRPAKAAAPTTDDATTAPAAEPAEQPGELINELDRKWLRYAPLTLSGLAAMGVLVGLVWRSLSEFDINDTGAVRAGLHWVESTPTSVIILIAVLVLLVVAVFGSILVYTLQFWGYRLTREADATLHVRRGLLTTSSVTIEESRLRGVEVREALLLRTAKGARCDAVSTGLRERKESHMLMPPGPLAVVNQVAGQVLGLADSPTDTPLIGHPAAALRRRMTRAIVPVAVLIALLAIAAQLGWVPGWAWQAALVLLPLAVLTGVDRFRNLGHVLNDQYLVTRTGALQRRTVALQRPGIIGWKVRQSFLQRRLDVLTLSATTAAGRGEYAVIDVGRAEGLAFADEATPGILTPFLVSGTAGD
jgi:putative membrane protein